MRINYLCIPVLLSIEYDESFEIQNCVVRLATYVARSLHKHMSDFHVVDQ